jgi:hypothetical protein
MRPKSDHHQYSALVDRPRKSTYPEKPSEIAFGKETMFFSVLGLMGGEKILTLFLLN